MRKSCEKCEKYNECTELCEEAEAYANQDWVKNKSNVYLYPEVDRFNGSWPSLDYVCYHEGVSASAFPYLDKYSDTSATELDLSFLTIREHQCVEYYYYEGMARSAIASLLGISRSAVDFYITKGRRKIIDKFSKGKDVRSSDQTYTYQRVERPSIGWQGLLVLNYFVKGMSIDECREEFKRLGYRLFGTGRSAKGCIRRIIRYYEANATLLEETIKKVIEYS